jgi:hypothetical protein
MHADKHQPPAPASDTHAGTPPGAQPVETSGEEPKGLPTSDRHFSETSSHSEGGNAAAEKHRHTA